MTILRLGVVKVASPRHTVHMNNAATSTSIDITGSIRCTCGWTQPAPRASFDPAAPVSMTAAFRIATAHRNAHEYDA